MNKNQKKHKRRGLLEVVRYNKWKEIKIFKKDLLNYLTSKWQLNHDPSLKELINNFQILENETKYLLIRTLRHFRVMKVLDGYYDPLGIYQIGEFK